MGRFLNPGNEAFSEEFMMPDAGRMAPYVGFTEADIWPTIRTGNRFLFRI